MPFCPKCGAAVEGSFCAQCGAPSGGSPADQAPSAGLTPNVTATLCYIPVFVPAVLFLVWGPYTKDKTVRFHALQSLFLQLGYVIAAIVAGIVLGAVSIWLLGVFSRVLNLAFVGLVVYLMVRTYQNRKVVLPVIGQFAEKHA